MRELWFYPFLDTRTKIKVQSLMSHQLRLDLAHPNSSFPTSSSLFFILPFQKLNVGRNFLDKSIWQRIMSWKFLCSSTVSGPSGVLVATLGAMCTLILG